MKTTRLATVALIGALATGASVDKIDDINAQLNDLEIFQKPDYLTAKEVAEEKNGFARLSCHEYFTVTEPC